MDKTDITYCRFCAEPRDMDKLLDLQMDPEKYQTMITKLRFLNAAYIDITDNYLPKTICFICIESLNNAYNFLNHVKDAQEIILSLYDKSKLDRFHLGETEKITLEDLIDDNELTIKREISSTSKKVPNVIPSSSELEVKIEPKEELDNFLPDNDASPDRSPSPQNYEETLSVQDILDAAMSEGSIASNMYHDMSEVVKKDIVTWKDYPWLCSHCNMEFQDMATLRKHSKIVHRKCLAFMCVDCKTVNSGFSLFIKHVSKHHSSLKNHCHYCDSAITEENFTEHINQHLQKSQIPCSACGEILKNQDALQKHVQDYNTVKPKRKPRRKRGVPITIAELTCPICQKVYKNPNSLRDHIKLHRSDRKRDHTCDRCGKTFFSKGTLTSHIMSHDQVRPYSCRICNKSFLFPNMLRRHVEMHSGVKPFSCEQCGRCFRLQYQLNSHKIIHTDAMPHVCQYCNKAFRFKQILKNHERQHTGAKPYACNQCGMEFTNWSNYNKHMKRRHGTDTSKKKITPEGVFPINPETGQIMQVHDAGMDEWKNEVMVPCKRGKKKVIKTEIA